MYLVTQSCLTLCNPMDCNLPGFSVHGDSPGKNTGMDCHALLQGIFPIQGLNPVSLIVGRFFTIWVKNSLPSEPPEKPSFKTRQQNKTISHFSNLIFPFGMVSRLVLGVNVARVPPTLPVEASWASCVGHLVQLSVHVPSSILKSEWNCTN